MLGSVILASTVVAGCSDEVPGAGITAVPAPNIVSTTSATELDRLGSALASGLARPAVRAGLRNALRASPYTDHRLDLSAYLATRAGRDLLHAAAAESRVPLGTLEEWVRSLPASDIYVPFREHRMRWRGGPDVRLGLVTRKDERVSSLRVYATDGLPGTLTREDGVPAYAFVVIAPSDFKIRRYRPQSAAHGAVIQDPDDGEFGGEFVVYGPDGTPLSGPTLLALEPADCYPTETDLVPCPDSGYGSEPLPPSTASPDTTILESFVIHEHFDPFWDGSMEVRMEIKHHRYVDPGAVRTTLATAVLRFSGISAGRTYTVQRIAFFSRVVESGSDGISYWLDEEDVLFNDWIGSRECRQMDGCQANGIPVRVSWKSSDCSGDIPNYNVGCSHRHTATVTSRWTPKY